MSAMKRDFEVFLATGEHGFLTEECRDRKIPVHIIPSLKRRIDPFADVKAFFAIRKLIRKIQPDLLHEHASKAAFLARLAGKMMGVPSVYTIQTWQFGTQSLGSVSTLVGLTCERLAANWCDRIITVADAGAVALRGNGVAADSKIVTIHNGMPDSVEQASPALGRPPTFVMVARFTAAKDHETLLRAFAKTRANARLQVVGDGPLRKKYMTLARTLGLADRVEFLGDRGDVPSILAAADVFVLASKSEMFPISILEAMRAGLPVIASRVGGVSEIVTHGETGLLVERQSVEELSNALNRMIDSPAVRESLGKEGRRQFLSKHLSIIMEEQTLALYANVLRTHGFEVPLPVPMGGDLRCVEASRL
jgi:glycosyltransferase involved in cell wall biosynthesis